MLTGNKRRLFMFIFCLFQQSPARGKRDQRIRQDPEGEAKGLRAQLSSPDEDKGNTGARHRRQG